MKKIHHYHRRFRLSLIRAGMLTVIACIFLMPSYVKFEKKGDNYKKLISEDVYHLISHQQNLLPKANAYYYIFRTSRQLSLLFRSWT